MSQSARRSTWFTSTIVLALVGFAEARPPSSKNPAPDLNKPLALHRAPASVNPLLEAPLRDFRRPGVSLLQQGGSTGSRWRLMGTCRRDVGVQNHEPGFGYGDCGN